MSLKLGHSLTWIGCFYSNLDLVVNPTLSLANHVYLYITIRDWTSSISCQQNPLVGYTCVCGGEMPQMTLSAYYVHKYANWWDIAFQTFKIEAYRPAQRTPLSRYLCDLYRIRHHVHIMYVRVLANALVFSHLDYWNLLLVVYESPVCRSSIGLTSLCNFINLFYLNKTDDRNVNTCLFKETVFSL